MIREAIITAAMAASIALPARVAADPGPVTQWLMQEPASLLDIGMMRLNGSLTVTENIIRTQNSVSADVFASADYNFSENKIYININIFEEIDEDKCGAVVESVRGSQGVGKGVAMFDSSFASRHFSHFGYEKVGTVKDVGKKLDEIIYIKVTGIKYERGKAQSFTSCGGKLMSTGFSVDRK